MNKEKSICGIEDNKCMENIGIVVVGYNRTESLNRILGSLARGVYKNSVDLIISIDKSDNQQVIKIAQNYEWKYGKKIIRQQKERLGLRKHILSCGDFFCDYDALIILEDDLMVSPYFYEYARHAVSFYKDDENIAGISLYTHLWNSHAHFAFEPIKSEYDTYFLQYAQSWGQVWLKKQWLAFKEWYDSNIKILEKGEEKLPLDIRKWPQTSWLKYHIKYCVDTNKYFVYPYISYTTDFTDVGVHNPETNTRFQVPLQYLPVSNYHFAPFNDEAIKYDVYFENQNFFKDNIKDCEIDLYGAKYRANVCKKKYLLTTLELPYEIVKSYGLYLRPIELNILMEVSGRDIFLYDLTSRKNIKCTDAYKVKLYDYFTKERFLMQDEYGAFLKNRLIKKYMRTKNKVRRN